MSIYVIVSSDFLLYFYFENKVYYFKCYLNIFFYLEGVWRVVLLEVNVFVKK